MGKFIHIRSAKFPILPGEQEELVNEGTYGKALANYLQVKLSERGYVVPLVGCEDWGWWVEIRSTPVALGVCVYCRPMEGGENHPIEFACSGGAARPRQWSWKSFRFVDTAPWTDKLHDDLMAVFQEDEDVVIVGESEEFPF